MKGKGAFVSCIAVRACCDGRLTGCVAPYFTSVRAGEMMLVRGLNVLAAGKKSRTGFESVYESQVLCNVEIIQLRSFIHD